MTEGSVEESLATRAGRLFEVYRQGNEATMFEGLPAGLAKFALRPVTAGATTVVSPPIEL